MSETNNNQGLGTESIGPLLAKLAVPSVIAQLVNLLYNIVDRIYIGHIPRVGASALTGVGLFAPILMLINAFAMLVGSGGAPRAAIAMGRKDNDYACRILGNCFVMLIALSAILTPIFYFACPTLLKWFGASSVTLPYAVTYSRIYIIGTICILLVMGLNPFITAQGFASVSMMTTVIGAVINIVLDPVFIFLFNMGVAGAAIATVISQAVGAIWILKFLSGSKTILKLKPAFMKPDTGVMLSCLALGVSTFIMLSTESILSISFSSSLARYGGDLAVGAMTIITSLSQLVMMPVSGFCQGCQPIVSYNYGAGLKNRVKQTFKYELIICAAYTTLFWLALMVIPRVFAGIFTSDSTLVEYTAGTMKIYMAGIFALGFQMSCQQTFVALGQAKSAMLMACLRKLILLIPLIFILPLILADKVFAVFLAEPISDIIAAIATTTLFFARFNKTLDSSGSKIEGKGRENVN